MKNLIFLLISLSLLNCSIASGYNDETQNELSVENSISIYCTPDLYNLTETWADEFCNLNPNVKVDVINVEEATAAERIIIENNPGFISSDFPEMYDKSTWNVVVGRDVIVPIYSSKNPFLDEIGQKGISPESLAQILKYPESKSWGTLLKNLKDVPVNFYMIDDVSINTGIAKLLEMDQISIDGVKVEDGKELIASVQKDPYSIGLCKITDIIDLNGQRLTESVKLLPIDRNGNGQIDYMEKIYDDLNVLSRGVWIGKYPNALVNNIYFTSPLKPTNEIEIAFIQWVLSDGQKYLDNYGYSDLVYSERRAKVDLLNNSKEEFVTTERNYAAANKVMLVFVLGSFGATVFILIIVNLRRFHQTIYSPENAADGVIISAQVLNEDLIDIPLGLYYDKTCTWTIMEKDGRVRIGINDFLQHITGPLTRVKLKRPGEKIRKGKPGLSIIQKGKQLNIQAPVSGTIKELNKDLKKNASLINSSPYSDGWVYLIEPTNWITEIQFLITGNKYKDWLKSEFFRLKDFLTNSVKPTVEYAHILQDGGELKDGILEDLGPEVWEDFQTSFIDLSV
jgi:glycine cleavage system H lipoate-binding protein/ABC-type phosphate transport system substrate-binding protein